MRQYLLCILLLLSGLLCCSCSIDRALVDRAEGGDATAQVALARKLLQRGPASQRCGILWLQLAAEAQNPNAWAALAVCYHKGLGGLEKDDEQAISCLKKAAELGHTGAAHSLLLVYRSTKDASQTIPWLQRVAARQYPPAERVLGLRYLRGQGVQQDLTKGVDFLRYAAMSGDRRAAALMADCYEKGIGVPRNPRLAEGWRNLAARE